MKNILVAVLVLSIILTFFVIEPFFTSVASGVVLAIIFYPIYMWLNRKLKNRSVSAALITAAILFVLFVPILFLLQQLGVQARVAYIIVRQKLFTDKIVNVCEHSQLACSITSLVDQVWNDPTFEFMKSYIIDALENILWNTAPSLITAIPSVILNIFVMILVIFYVLRDGDSLMCYIDNVIPLGDEHKQKLFTRFSDVIHGVVHGHVITALVQGSVGIIGLYIFGFQSPLVVGIIITIASLIPFIGTPFVWVPVAGAKILDGLASGNNKVTAMGIGFFLYGFFVISTIDNIIKPKLVGDRSKINPVIVLLGMLGGIAMFGISGIILGPIVLALTQTLIEIYLEEKNGIKC